MDRDKSFLEGLTKRYNPQDFARFTELAFSLQEAGISKKVFLAYLTELIVAEDLPWYQLDLFEDFVSRSDGWCTSGQEVDWPKP